MSKVEMIRALYEYNEWANEHVLAVASGLSEEELGRELGASYGSVQGNLMHIVGAQVVWLARWKGDIRVSPPRIEEGRVMEALREGYATSHRELGSFVGSLGEEQLDGVLAYRDSRGKANQRPLWQLMAHVVNHGTQHRSETAMALTALGSLPGDLDYVYFELERGKA